MAAEGVIVNPSAKNKLIFLGDPFVGKSSIMCRFVYGYFSTTIPETLGIDFIPEWVRLEDRTVRMELWDTCDCERFRSFLPSYIKDSVVAVVTYDVASKKSFLNTENWVEIVRADRGNDVNIILVGNKTDLESKRQVSVEQGILMARKLDVMFIETSAKSGSNIEDLFRNVASVLPAMETFSATEHEEEKVDVNLRSSSVSSSQPESNGWVIIN